MVNSKKSHSYFQIWLNLAPLFVVQFFTWLAFFALWIYGTPFFVQYFFHSGDGEADFEAGVRWAGYAFALYATVGAVLAFSIEKLAAKTGKAKFHAYALLVGSIGIGSLYVMPDKFLTLISFVLIGIAWSSISNVPYYLVEKISEMNNADENVDSYFKIFNFSVVIPQVTAAFFWSYLSKNVFDGKSNYVILSGAGSLLVAAVLMFFIAHNFEISENEDLSE